MVVFGQKWLYSGKCGFYKGIVVVFMAKVVEFGQMRLCSGKSQMGLYSGKSRCIRKFGCIPAKWFYSGKVVVFGQKWLYSGKNC